MTDLQSMNCNATLQYVILYLGSHCITQNALEIAGGSPALSMLHLLQASFTSMVLQWPMLSGMAAQGAGAPGA